MNKPSLRLRLRLREIWGDWFHPDGQWQPWVTTREDRYPQLFAAIAAELGNRPAEVLSFGCATGEEVFSLRHYLPQANLHGIDINGAALALARHRLTGTANAEAIRFSQANNTKAEPDEFYDAVFACAVFRHARLNRRPPRCTPLLRFADFEQALQDFTRIIRPSGFLVLRSANFRLADTQMSNAFESLLAVPPTHPVPPIFGPDNCLLADAVGDDGIFCRLPR